MRIQTILRSKWLVKFHPSIEAGDGVWDAIRWMCRHHVFRKPRTGNAYDMRTTLEGHIRDRING
jgi:hypothetical protein